MEVLKIKQDNWLKEVTKCITGGEYKILYGIVERPVAIVHRKTQVDENLCADLSYEIVESFCNGGTILSNSGDLLFAHFYKPGREWYNKFVFYFVDWLKSKGLNAEFVGNDVLIDDYKVCGMCITRYGRIDYTGGVISMNVNLDHIKKICRKPMIKVPKSLYEYGITTEEVEQMFLEFCKMKG